MKLMRRINITKLVFTFELYDSEILAKQGNY